MTRVIIVADSGPALSHLTSAVATVPGAYIVRHGSTTRPLDRLVESHTPDLVVIGDLLTPTHALARLAEVRRAAPDAKVVVLSSLPEADWLADALRAKASAVLPGNVEPHTLGLVLSEVIAAPAPAAPAERLARPARERRTHHRPRGARPVAVAPAGAGGMTSSSPRTRKVRQCDS